jgi:hypothetical protein
MTGFATSAAARTASKVVLAFATLLVLATAAAAVDRRVERACANDYLTYCSQHDPDGPGVRQCMRANGLKLSTGCVSALVAAGEVSKAEVGRRSAGK